MEELKKVAEAKYKYGFVSDIKSETIEKGLNENIIRLISSKKNEPEWLLNFRLESYKKWLTMKDPDWAKINYPKVDYQDMYYYSEPSNKDDKEIKKTYEKLGVPVTESKDKKIAVDAVFDSVSVITTHKKELEDLGIIFCSFSTAVRNHPELVKKYLATVVPAADNFFACLNSAVFSDGSFVFIPKGVKCPIELSTYFRINAPKTGQFERTLIVAEEGASVSYLEGCTAPQRDENQLHSAVVELVALDNADIKYATVQNWYTGDENGKGGIYNFVTKRGLANNNAKISWAQIETGSSITWKYPSCILKGDNSIGEFHSIAITNNHQQADTGTKMIHLGKNTKSKIIAKTISCGESDSSYRGMVKVVKRAENARNFTQCDSLLIGDKCGAHTFPIIENDNKSSNLEHEATTSKISEDQMFYCKQRGIKEEDAISLIVSGFCAGVLTEMPLEFASEAQELIKISLEGSVG